MKRSVTSNAKSNKISKTIKHESLQLPPNWTEFYLLNGYASNVDKTQIYAENSESKPKIFIDSQNKQIYATKMEGTDKVEYLPKDKDGNLIYIKDQQNRIRYPRNISSNKFQLPKDNDGNEVYISDAGKTVYPIDGDGNPVYARNRDGEPIFITELNKLIYGTNSNGDEIYPKDNAGDEIYMRYDNKEHPASMATGNLYYAKKSNGDEYYPKVFCDQQCPEKVDLRDKYEVILEKGIVVVK